MIALSSEAVLTRVTMLFAQIGFAIKLRLMIALPSAKFLRCEVVIGGGLQSFQKRLEGHDAFLGEPDFN